MSIWCVAPEETTIELSYAAPDGTAYPFWIKVKKFLNVGEDRRVTTAGWKAVSRAAQPTLPGDTEPTGAGGETKIEINWQQQTFARTAAYLLDWSLLDDQKRKLPIPAAITELKTDVYALIENAITAHVEAMVQEKKVTSGSSVPSMTIAS